MVFFETFSFDCSSNCRPSSISLFRLTCLLWVLRSLIKAACPLFRNSSLLTTDFATVPVATAPLPESEIMFELGLAEQAMGRNSLDFDFASSATDGSTQGEGGGGHRCCWTIRAGTIGCPMGIEAAFAISLSCVLFFVEGWQKFSTICCCFWLTVLGTVL